MSPKTTPSEPFDLEVAMLNAGLSIRGLAAEIKVPEQSIRRVRDGEPVHPANAKKIADRFGVEVIDLKPFRGVGDAR
jgi:ribosome-binding protein aMBF1 (putative translation factor)